MKKDNSCSRKTFLKTAGSTALFAAIGINLTGCGSTMDSNGDPTPGPGGPGPTEPPEGVTINGNTVTIDITHQSFSHLANEGQWEMITQAGLLVVNVDGNSIRAFTNTCTHEHCTDDWSFSNGLFRCGPGVCGHGSEFNTSGEWVSGAQDQPGVNTGDLLEYGVTRSDNTVTINKA